MAKKIVLTALGLIIVVGGLAGVKILQFQTMAAQAANAGPPPEVVAVRQVSEAVWQPTLDAVGTITAVQGVTLSAEVPGTVKRIAFESGSTVKAGEVLVELDSSTERAQLKAAEANAELARTNLDSGRQLAQSGAIATTQLNTQEAAAKQTVAELARLQTIIAKKTLRAPFSGRTGLRMINLGQFVGNGDKIVSLQSPDPLYVDFALPQQRLSELKVGLEVRVTSDAYPESTYPGQLSAIQPELDQATRNIRLRATLRNPKGELRPGMFVRAQVVLPDDQHVLVVPATAIMYAPYGDSVFVVQAPKPEADAQDKSQPQADKPKADAPPSKPKPSSQLVAQQKFVRLGDTRGDLVSITQGLLVGDQVVVSGAFKLRNGTPVVINNELAPDASEHPKPTDT